MEQFRQQSFAPESRSIRVWSIVIATVVVSIAVACLPAIPQAAHFHNFADQRGWVGIPNLLNVISNVTFVLGGIAGLRFLSRPSNIPFAKAPWCMFFVGAVLTGLGSAYYHLAPDNARLVWDRLPMTIVFMSLLAAVITERISANGGLLLLFPLLLLGVGSVVYWHFTEQAGQGDLRLYGFVQFYPVLLIPVILLLFPARYTHSGYLFAMIGVYALAKVGEHFDAELLALGNVVSGHTIKHLIASLPIWFVWQMLRSRKPTEYSGLHSTQIPEGKSPLDRQFSK